MRALFLFLAIIYGAGVDIVARAANEQSYGGYFSSVFTNSVALNTTVLSGTAPVINASNGLQRITLAGATVPTLVGMGTMASSCSQQSFNSFNGTTFIAESAGVTNVAP